MSPFEAIDLPEFFKKMLVSDLHGRNGKDPGQVQACAPDGKSLHGERTELLPHSV